MKKTSWVVAGIAVAFVSGCSGSDQAAISHPATQQEFSLLNSKCKAMYAEGLNDIQKSLAFNQCNKDRLQFSRERKISGWVGEITDISTDQGAEVVSVTLNTTTDGFRMSFGTVTNRVSDYATDSMITPKNPLFNVLAQMKEGELVSFDASFLPHPESSRGLWESSLTERGSMDEPEFSVRFTDIRPYEAESKAVATDVDAAHSAQVGAPQTSESQSGNSTDASEADCNDPQNQIEMNQCASQELDAETAAINSVYRSYRATLGAFERQRLKEEELAWIKSKDATCEKEASDVAGGSAHSAVLAHCLIGQSKARRKQLEAWTRCGMAGLSRESCSSAAGPGIESDTDLTSLIGRDYGAGKRLLADAGYEPDRGAETYSEVNSDPANCGNAGCSLPWKNSDGGSLCVGVRVDDNKEESSWEISGVDSGECD